MAKGHDFFQYGYAAGGGTRTRRDYSELGKGIGALGAGVSKYVKGKSKYAEDQRDKGNELIDEITDNYGQNEKLEEAGINVDGIKNQVVQNVRKEITDLEKAYQGIGIFKKKLNKSEFDQKRNEILGKLNVLDGVDNTSNALINLHTNDKGGSGAAQLSNATPPQNQIMARKYSNNELTPNLVDGKVVWTDTTDGKNYSQEEINKFTKSITEAPDPEKNRTERISFLTEQRNSENADQPATNLYGDAAPDETELISLQSQWKRLGIHEDEIRRRSGLFRSRENAGLNANERELEEDVFESEYDNEDPDVIASKMQDYEAGKSALAKLQTFEDVIAMNTVESDDPDEPQSFEKLRIPALSEDASAAKIAEYAETWPTLDNRQKWDILQTLKDEDNVTLGKELYVTTQANEIDKTLRTNAGDTFGTAYDEEQTRLGKSLDLDIKEQKLATGKLNQKELLQKIKKGQTTDAKGVLATDINTLIDSNISPILSGITTETPITDAQISEIKTSLDSVNSIMLKDYKASYDKDSGEFIMKAPQVISIGGGVIKEGEHVEVGRYKDPRAFKLAVMQQSGVSEKEIESVRLNLYPELQTPSRLKALLNKK